MQRRRLSVLPFTIDDRVRQTRETAENAGVFGDRAASGEADRRAEVTATRFEGVDAPSIESGNARSRRAARLHGLAHLHSPHRNGLPAPAAISRESTATRPCRKEIA
jgi:hypothetical protein